ncbi:MAG: tRNA 2-thiouridine(34) synthase MnmA [Clostridia bacterium]
MGNKVMLGMSGGIDSAMSAYFLLQDGKEPTGVNCRFFTNDDANIKQKTCCSLDDSQDARLVAYKLGIPFHVFNFTSQFNENVIKRFIHAYEVGETPNPCIDCNKYLKFDEMLKRAMQLDFDSIATGHYAINEFDEKTGRWLLKKALDETKDQSYVLYSLSQFQLSKILFPLGTKKKSEIRVLAEELGLAIAKKHDSQDICFVPDSDYAGFIEKYSGKSYPDGEFVDLQGNVLGTHKGIIRYTVGQRRGLGLALPAPMYVVKKDIENNKVILGDNQSLLSKTVIAHNINLIPFDKIEGEIRVKAKIRYNQKEQWATAKQIDLDTLYVEFDEPQRAVAKGQSVVLYDGDVVVGGGIIE